jgi:UDP-N-acetylmuramoyl-tripeptide--D-alanyl-D-alanine ligase
MKTWPPERIATEAGARLIAPPAAAAGPERVVLDSRQARAGALFVGLPGEQVDGGRFAAQALAAGAWGVLTAPEHAEAAKAAMPGVLLAAEDPLAALQRLARAWRRELGASVIGVTGSTGKTSTKDLLLGLLAPHRRTVASRANFNTEIGLPLEILDAPAGTEVLVLEMAMRGAGQIGELAAIAEPDVGVIVSVGPVHLELLGTIHAIAAAKAELLEGLPPDGTAVIPAGEPLLEPHRREDLETVTFGQGGDVELRSAEELPGGDGTRVRIALRGEEIALEVPFTQAHLLTNLLAAAAAARAVGVMPSGRLELALSPGRGQRVSLPDEVTLIDDCYNANPMSMRAALDDLAATAARNAAARRFAVLGDMLELGADERRFHVEIGEHASQVGVDVLVTVGPLAAAMGDAFDGELHAVADAGEAAALVPELLAPGDVVLVKASRGVGLELVCHALSAGAPA